MSKSTLLFLLINSTFLFFTCKKNTNTENLAVAKGLDYYPLEIGKYITYELDSIIYNLNPVCSYPYPKDTFSWQLKEEVVNVFPDNLGDENYIIERSLRKNNNEPWQIKDVWNTKITNTQVERVEENLRFIKLVFPVSSTVAWKGNNFFQDTSIVIGSEIIEFYKHWSSHYEYANIDESEVINGITFDSVMTVIQSNQYSNQIEHRVATEKYARGVGLIFKEMIILDSQCCFINGSVEECLDMPWEERGEKGLILRQRIIDYN